MQFSSRFSPSSDKKTSTISSDRKTSVMFNFAASPQSLDNSQMENTVASDSEYSSSCIVELMNYEEHDEWSISPSSLSNQMFPSFSMPFSSNFSPLEDVESLEDYISRSEVSCGAEKTAIPRCPKLSLNEKMFKALHLCAQWFGGGTLAQVWVPTRVGDHNVLTTSEQPFLHDGTLSEYREVSRMFTFATELGTSSLLGLPGRVFTSKVPEWTSNVTYYNEAEYLRVQHAIDLDIRGSIALPVFEDQHEGICCAVLEIVMTAEKPNFDSEMDNICCALQAVDLSSTQFPLISPKVLYKDVFSLSRFILRASRQNSIANLQSLSGNQNTALAEIKDVLSIICRAHRLPLALTWIRRTHTKSSDDHDETASVLCLEESACFWNDPCMEGFVHACKNHFLEEGKGLVGKALQLNEPFFYSDVREFHVSEYPLVHHARKLGLRGAVAIRIISAFTGGDEYIVEFFLPLNLEGDKEQLRLVNTLMENMGKICRSLNEDSDTELVQEKKPDVRLLNCKIEDTSTAELLNDELHSSDMELADLYGTTTELSNNDPIKKTTVGISRQMEKRRNKSEKNISLSVLQQYFSGSLKDAAKSLGVSPTTLKRICRQHGISRWPSRKLKKVDHSLKKLQGMLESVPGMEGGFKFDQTKGQVIASFSMAGEECGRGKNLSAKDQNSLPEQSDTRALNSATSEVFDVDREDNLSNRTDSPNMSESMLMTNASSSSSGSFDEKSPSRREPSNGYTGTKITVKATLGENTVRFKFEPDLGCFELYSEVAKRFQLQTGEFQLRYLDDDEELVLMVTDLDLVECLEVLEVLQTSTVKFKVDVSTRNSGTNTCFVATSH